MSKIEVCFSPDLFPFYENDDAIAVVIDIFRATSAMCMAFENGMEKIIPVEHVEEALDYKKKGYLVAAERKGEIVEGFDLGNSPFHYMNANYKGKTLVITTTNGTRAIKIASKHNQVVVGSFLNYSAVCEYLMEQGKDVLLVCAGWRGRFNLEDSLFAGAVVDCLLESGQDHDLSDSSIASRHFWKMASGNLGAFVQNSSHRKRLAKLNLEKDIDFCLKMNETKALPILVQNELLNFSQ